MRIWAWAGALTIALGLGGAGLMPSAAEAQGCCRSCPASQRDPMTGCCPPSACRDTPTRRRLTVTTDPPGATVSIDGRARGTSPVTVRLSPGTYRVEARLAGRGTASQGVTIGRRSQTVALSLGPPGTEIAACQGDAECLGNRAACVGGDYDRCWLLGSFYRERGTTEDGRRAVSLYEYACRNGSARGCSDLGWLYEHGAPGILADFTRAAALYNQACEANWPPGCNNLAWLYEHGNGPPRDLGRAERLYSRACGARNQVACENLGRMLEGIDGRDGDALEAYRLGCQYGSTPACEGQQRLEREVRPGPGPGPGPAPGAEPWRACGQSPGSPRWGSMRVGSEVVLARHTTVSGDANWNPAMDAFVGRTVRIRELAGVDPQGCLVVRVDADNGQWLWRLRDVQMPLPQACGMTDATARFGSLRVGSRVILGRHRPVNGDANWAPNMDPWVGRPAQVTGLAGTDGAGCPVVRVDADSGQFVWRVRDLGLP
jgi:hypothetical protein